MRSLRDDIPLHFSIGGMAFNDAGAHERHPVLRTGPRQGGPSRQLRIHVLQRDHFICQLCLQRGGTLEVDHITPWSAGGEDTATNLRTLCQACNQHRSNFHYPGDPQPLPIAPCNRCATRSDATHTLRAWCPLCRSVGTTNPAEAPAPPTTAADAYAAPCPACHARPGERCTRAGTTHRVALHNPHPSRQDPSDNEHSHPNRTRGHS